jgi:hypothetical protein
VTCQCQGHLVLHMGHVLHMQHSQGLMPQGRGSGGPGSPPDRYSPGSSTTRTSSMPGTARKPASTSLPIG